MLKHWIRKAFYWLPARLRFLIRRAIYFPIDFIETVSKTRPTLVPPRGLIFTGSGDFVRSGNELVRRFIELGGLRPTDAFLDVGSGIGRVAIPLTRYLKNGGRYEGFDPIKLGINYCQKTITPLYPNFKFQYTPLLNDLYRNDGHDAAYFRFPFDDETFDFVCLNSVFTHMISQEVENYLNEISRVLKKGGVCYASFFILNEETRKTMLPEFSFPFKEANHFLMDKNVRSANVAFEENWLLHEFDTRGLTILQKNTGFWAGREPTAHLDFQDVVILKKAFLT